MCAILSFVPRDAATKPARPPIEGAAAVIIFPGVRYERSQADQGGALPLADTKVDPAKH